MFVFRWRGRDVRSGVLEIQPVFIFPVCCPVRGWALADAVAIG